MTKAGPRPLANRHRLRAAWSPLGACLIVLLLAGLAASPSQEGAEADGPYTVYLPFVTKSSKIFLPAVFNISELKLNIIANPSFENEAWFTDVAGNQRPAGWTFFAPATGQPLPFPTKRQGNLTVPAISGGQGEYVHKYYWQLPDNERVGGTRGLILDGQLTYKVFSDHLAHALRLSQTLAYAPGRWVKVTGYILGETQIFACSGNGVLEDDHFIGSVQLGSTADTRFFKVMTNRHDVPGNERPWNKFSVTAQVPANGKLPLVVIMQTNWNCPADFFIDHFEAFEVNQP